MSEKCTLTPEERAEAWRLFDNTLEPDEVEAIESLFTGYLIYRGKGKTREYCCTKCGGFSASGGPYGHNLRRHCPNCGAEVVLKAYGRLGTYQTMTEKHNVVLFRVGPAGELLISAGLAFRDYHDGEFSGFDDVDDPIYPVPDTEYYERRRYYLAPGRIAAWKRWEGPRYSLGHIVHMATSTPWESMKSASEPFPRSSALYPSADDGMYYMIGKEKIAESSLRYSQVENYFDFAWTEPSDLVRMVVSYLVSYCVRPQIEMLVKMCSGDVVSDLLVGNRNARLVNWKAKNPPAFFRLSKADYREFAKRGSPLWMLQYFKECGNGFNSLSEFMAVVQGVDRRTFNNVSELAGQIGRSVKDVLRKVPRKDLSVWMDYVDMASEEDYDFSEETVCFPKNLIERHDALAELVKVRKDKDERRMYAGRYKALRRRYKFEWAGLCIVVPVSSHDIVEEGQAMHHCVAGYAARHIQGKLDILFLRDAKTGERMATIEMNGDGMVQIRGPYNDRGEVPAEERYKFFTDVWLDWIRRGSRRDTAGNPVMIRKVGVA